jgi:hypothetical protein
VNKRQEAAQLLIEREPRNEPMGGMMSIEDEFTRALAKKRRVCTLCGMSISDREARDNRCIHYQCVASTRS